jgi:hypothetical protein
LATLAVKTKYLQQCCFVNTQKKNSLKLVDNLDLLCLHVINLVIRFGL